MIKPGLDINELMISHGTDNLVLDDCIEHNDKYTNPLDSSAYMFLTAPFDISDYGRDSQRYLDMVMTFLDNRDNFKGKVIGVGDLNAYRNMSRLRKHGYIDRMILAENGPDLSKSETKSIQNAELYFAGTNIGDTIRWLEQFVNPNHMTVITDMEIHVPKRFSLLTPDYKMHFIQVKDHIPLVEVPVYVHA